MYIFWIIFTRQRFRTKTIRRLVRGLEDWTTNNPLKRKTNGNLSIMKSLTEFASFLIILCDRLIKTEELLDNLLKKLRIVERNSKWHEIWNRSSLRIFDQAFVMNFISMEFKNNLSFKFNNDLDNIKDFYYVKYTVYSKFLILEMV